MVKLSTRTLSIRLAVLSGCLVLLAFGCADDGADTELTVDASMSADMTVGSTDQELAEPDTMVMTDAEVQTPDAQITESDVGETITDVAVTPVDMDTVESDAEVEVDADVVPTVDAEVQMETDSGNTMSPLGCRLGDAWTVLLQAVPPPGMGCQQGGGSGQSDVTHRLVVDNPGGGPGSVTGYVVRPDLSARAFTESGADNVYTEATFTQDGDSCVLNARAVLGVNFPPDGSCNNRPTEVRMTYEYSLRATDGIVEGTGFVISGYGSYPIPGNMDPATVEPCRAPCSEPLLFSGGIEVP